MLPDNQQAMPGEERAMVEEGESIFVFENADSIKVAAGDSAKCAFCVWIYECAKLESRVRAFSFHFPV